VTDAIMEEGVERDMSDPATADVRAATCAADLDDELELMTRKLAEAHKMASLGRLAAGIVHGDPWNH
jgi:C4-dicarboxylate-specific signal transduction histidine kinase